MLSNQLKANGLKFLKPFINSQGMVCPKLGRRFRGIRSWPTWPNDWVPFQWAPKELIPAVFDTGDSIEGLDPVDPDKLLPEYENLEILKTAPELVRRQYTYRYAKRGVIANIQRDEYEKEFKNRPFDATEYERKICRYTVTIRSLREELRKAPHQVQLKILITQTNLKRNKFLNEMFKKDRPAYERLSEKLKVDYNPPLPYYVEYPFFERKRDIRRCCDEYCDKIVNGKLKAYHEQLKKERVEFEQEKENKLKWIDEQMARFSITEEMLEEPVPKLHERGYIDWQ